MYKFFILISVAIELSAYAGGRDCDWAIAVNRDNPPRIAYNSERIGFIRSLITKQNETLDKEIYPQLHLSKHTISVYDENSQTQMQAQIIVGQALIYMKETIIADRSIKAIFDRMAKKGALRSELSLANQIRDAIPNMKMSDSARLQIESWARAVGMIEALRPDWNEIEKKIIAALPSSKGSLADSLVDELAALNDRLAANLRNLGSARDQDQQKVQQLEQIVVDIQRKISEYLDQIAELKKQIDFWQGQINANSPVSNFCPTIERHYFR